MSGSSVLLVPVPEVEHLIDPLRRRLDPTRRQGMPAHVTILVPFAPAHLLDGAVRRRLGALFGAFPSFEFALRGWGWFDRRVLYLRPDPPGPFREMTRAVVGAFPDYLPYEGAFDDIVPHVTIGEGGRLRKRRSGLRRAEKQLAGMEPVLATASEVWLMELGSRDGRWRAVAAFALGDRPEGSAAAAGETSPYDSSARS